MLSLSVRTGEALYIDGGRIVIRAYEIPQRGKVKLAITAPPEVRVDREKIHFRRECARRAQRAAKWLERGAELAKVGHEGDPNVDLGGEGGAA